MTKEQVKEALSRVLAWPEKDQERVVRFVEQVEQLLGGDDITDDEWKLIEQRAARRELASDQEVEAVFGRYRKA